MLLRENILRLMSNVDVYREISHAQRERILERYVWDQIAARYVDVYRSVLTGRRRRSQRLRAEPQARH